MSVIQNRVRRIQVLKKAIMDTGVAYKITNSDYHIVIAFGERFCGLDGLRVEKSQGIAKALEQAFARIKKLKEENNLFTA